MSAINHNAFAIAYPAVTGATPEFETATSGGRMQLPFARSNDSIVPIVTPNEPAAPLEYPGYFGSSGGSGSGSVSGLSGFNALLSGFVNALQNLLAGIGQQFGLTGLNGNQPSPMPAQTFFKSATSSSVGDPHESFNGTTSTGGSLSQKWNSMDSHSDLLSSDSFEGGYRVSTTATAPNAKGTTLNANAKVALDGGATTVSMNADGSYAVSSDGRSVSLQQGQAVSLGDGASVTLQADNSLTISDSNASGGSLVTTLASNGAGGVDVHATASNVDLGGYLVSENDSSWPNGPHPLRMTGVPEQAPISYASEPTSAANFEGEPVVMA